MAWADQVERANAAFLQTWGQDAVWQPQDGSAPSTITGIKKNPGIQEEVSRGTNVIRFWIDSNLLNPSPATGDTITLDGLSYDVGDTPADIEGGMVLILRRNA